MAKLAMRGQGWPKLHAHDLARRMRAMGARARAVLVREVAPAIAEGRERDVEAGVRRAAELAAEDASAARVAAATARVGARQSEQRAAEWYRALARSTGATIVVGPAPELAGAAKVLPGGVAMVIPGAGVYEPPAGIGGALRGQRLLITPSPPPVSTLSAARESADLISMVSSSVAEATAQVIAEARATGATAQEVAARLAADWRARGVPAYMPTRRLTSEGVPVVTTLEAHAALVAEDQLIKLAAAEQAAQQADAGIEYFRWVTSGDARVREAHRERAGKVYSWERGADGELPGQPVRCRCHAEPVATTQALLESRQVTVIEGSGAPVERERAAVRRANIKAFRAQSRAARR